MTPAQLQALRRLLFFSVSDAARLIGGCSERSWQYWESGKRTIPADVIATIYHLCHWRNGIIASPADLRIADHEQLYLYPYQSAQAEILSRQL